jgi:hypothetical protein
MIKIQQYSARRIKDGSRVQGYVAQGTECECTFILTPATANSFHTFEVDAETLEAI